VSSTTAPAPPFLPRIANGDAGSVAAFLDAYGPLVQGLAQRFTSDPGERDDAVQEIFVELWRLAERFDPTRSSEPAFVTMVSRRRLIDRRRRLGREAPTEDIESAGHVASTEPSAADRIAEADEVDRARAALDTLRPEERQVLELSIWESLSHSEISDRLSLPLGTVKTHARRGLIRVREALARGATPS
jgi:RNA polymerase sigma-70 factor (ECF subfamily)